MLEKSFILGISDFIYYYVFPNAEQEADVESNFSIFMFVFENIVERRCLLQSKLYVCDVSICFVKMSKQRNNAVLLQEAV